jgi:nucleotide-binding universal stress UspA family protein
MSWPIKKGTIVVPFDFSEPAQHALQVAGAFAADPSQVLVVYAIAPLLATEPGVVWNTLDEEKARKHAAESLASALGEHGCAGFRSEVIIGDPAHVVLTRAKDVDAELIVIPTHGRTGLRRFVMGSVAERVVRLAHCPVLVLRQHDPED